MNEIDIMSDRLRVLFHTQVHIIDVYLHLIVSFNITHSISFTMTTYQKIIFFIFIANKMYIKNKLFVGSSCNEQQKRKKLILLQK